jgi:DNA-directed RNA polymerase beta subunit
MEPSSGVFKLKVGQANLKAYPILKAMGIKDRDMEKHWGPELLRVNLVENEDVKTLNKAWNKFTQSRAKKSVGEDVTDKDWLEVFSKLKLDPEVVGVTLGSPYTNVTPEVLLKTSEKLVNISKGKADTDDRDSLAFQETWGPEDFFAERISKDSGMLARKLLWKATLNKSLKKISPSALDSHVDSVFYLSGVASPLEEINPMDAIDQNLRITRMGVGGLPSAEAVPDEARALQPSHFGFIDPIRSPESSNPGVDGRIAWNTYKGVDRELYTRLKDSKSGKSIYLPPQVVSRMPIAFPGEHEKAAKTGKKVKCISNGQMKMMDPEKVPYELYSASGQFNLNSNLVPMLSAIEGGRLLMGSKYINQALSVKNREAPLVRPVDEDGVDFFNFSGKYAGVVRSDTEGVVRSVTDDEVVIQTSDGKTKTIELYNNMPYNRKSYISNEPLVQPGDVLKPGQIIASSNYTDKSGDLALGAHVRAGYLPYKGYSYEDGIVISEGLAKKFASEHMYTDKLDRDKFTTQSKLKHMSVFPSVYSKKQLDKIDKSGVVAPGSVVEKGDPLILAVKQKTSKGSGMLYRGKSRDFSDSSVEWEHDTPGIVTDTWNDDGGTKISVKTYMPVQVGDKFSGFFGNKGTVSKIIPDDQMPKDESGETLEMLLNPLGVISRHNPAQLYEAVLAKIARKRGKPYYVRGFNDDSLIDFVKSEMSKHGVKDKETIYDPATDKNIKDVFVGFPYMLKLQHTSESKESGRAFGSYTSEGSPSKGIDEDNPKRIGMLEMEALLAHGAVKNIKDIRNIKGQQNQDYWNAVMLGINPPPPKVPGTYKKFIATLQASGINVKGEGNNLHLAAMTDRDVEAISSGEIKSPETVKWKQNYAKGLMGEQSMEPVKGGLFDRGITGGHGGNRFGHITLSVPMPQPVFEDPIRYLLGLTQKQYRNVIAEKESIPDVGTGSAAIKKALSHIDIDKMYRAQEHLFNTTSSKTAKNLAAKKMKYLDGLRRMGVQPEDLVVSKVAVLPPVYRPITATNKFEMVAGSNLLYKDLMHANQNYSEMKDKLTPDMRGEAALNVYDNFKAVTGLGTPVKKERKAQGIKGLLKEVFGASPKSGTFQRTLISTTTDLSGRAVISPDPNLDIDEVGLPEEKAWELYKPFVIRRLIRDIGSKGSKADAIRMYMNKTPEAERALLKEMEHRPLLYSRAPALHKYSILAAKPVLTRGHSFKVPPQICKGMNADFDGDTMNFHVTVSDEAIEEAKEKMLPSKNIRKMSDFQVQYAPSHEFLIGLHRATHKEDLTKKPIVFDTVQQAVNAYNRGEVEVDQPVIIK